MTCMDCRRPARWVYPNGDATCALHTPWWKRAAGAFAWAFLVFAGVRR